MRAPLMKMLSSSRCRFSVVYKSLLIAVAFFAITEVANLTFLGVVLLAGGIGVFYLCIYYKSPERV